MAARYQWRIGKDGEPVRLSPLEVKLWDGKLTGQTALAGARWIADKKQRREQAEQAAAVAEDAADDQAADRLERQRLELQATEWANQRDYERWLFDQLDAKPDPPRAPFPF